MNQYTKHPIPPETRFWSHVDKSGTHGSWNGTPCWVWTAHCMHDGYGTFKFKGKDELAHRVAYLMTHGSIPPGHEILHHCDNPPCCNPAHLFTGTQFDNMRDMVAKGRQNFQKHRELVCRGDSHWSRLHPERVRRGSNHYMCLHPEKRARIQGSGNPQAKLTEQQVINIRNAHGLTQKQLAKQYGVSRSLIGLIIQRKIWTNI